MNPNITTERSSAATSFPAGIGYRAVCCPDPALRAHRHYLTAVQDWMEHQFTHHDACHPRFCADYRRHGTTADGTPAPCPPHEPTACGGDLSLRGTHWNIYTGTCNRLPHPDHEPCSAHRDFDVVQWTAAQQEESATQKALLEQLKAS